MGVFYKLLKQIGVSVTERSNEGLERISLDSLRQQAMKSSGAVDPVSPDLSGQVVPELPEAKWLGEAPSSQEIDEAFCLLRDSAPGLDEVTMHMLKHSGPRCRW